MLSLLVVMAQQGVSKTIAPGRHPLGKEKDRHHRAIESTTAKRTDSSQGALIKNEGSVKGKARGADPARPASGHTCPTYGALHAYAAKTYQIHDFSPTA